MKLQKLELQIRSLANKINVPADLLPQVNESNNYAKPFIEFGGMDDFYYVIRERGVEYERVLYRDEQELSYRIFKDITFEMAKTFELNNRNNNEDFRIILFKEQEELLNLLKNDWGTRIKAENDKYLEI
ncbi:Imm63 family immunity protein [Cloacibacterium sp.]|uniref:Imm63 family immunity protein n=1 Tax=Cloacibacterium sp. TaxID=1913682 RepID=UPI0035AE417E